MKDDLTNRKAFAQAAQSNANPKEFARYYAAVGLIGRATGVCWFCACVVAKAAFSLFTQFSEKFFNGMAYGAGGMAGVAILAWLSGFGVVK